MQIWYKLVDKSYLVCPYQHKHLRSKMNQSLSRLKKEFYFHLWKDLSIILLSLFQKIKKVFNWKVYTRDFQYRLKFCDKCSHSIMSYKFFLLFCEVVNKYRSHISCHMSSKKVCLQNYFICRWRKKKIYIVLLTTCFL